MRVGLGLELHTSTCFGASLCVAAGAGRRRCVGLGVGSDTGVTRAGTCAGLGIGLALGFGTGSSVQVDAHGHGAIAFLAVVGVLHRFKGHVFGFEVYITSGFHRGALQQQLVGHVEFEVAPGLDARTRVGDLQRLAVLLVNAQHVHCVLGRGFGRSLGRRCSTGACFHAHAVGLALAFGRDTRAGLRTGFTAGLGAGLVVAAGIQAQAYRGGAGAALLDVLRGQQVHIGGLQVEVARGVQV